MIVRCRAKSSPHHERSGLGFWDFFHRRRNRGVKQPRNIDGISMMPTLSALKQTNQHEFL